MSDQGYETARITITRVMTAEGGDETFVEASDDLTLVEALGLLRLAEDTVIEHPPMEGADDFGTATVYVLGDTLAVDCDTCHESLIAGPPTVAVGSAWIAQSVERHACQTEEET